MTGPWSSVEDQRAALQRAANRSGCRVLSMGTRSTSLGQYVTARLACPHGWAGAALLSALAEEDAATAGARDAALELRRAHPGDDGFARAVFEAAKRLRFDREAGEVFAMGSYTWDAGGGDCDDHARAVVALLRAGGLPARIAYLHAPGREPSHAVAQVWLDGSGWTWLESTLDARMGEHPIAAARRLGKVRSDLALETAILDPTTLRPNMHDTTTTGGQDLGALTADQVAAYELRRNSGDLSPAFMVGVAAIAQRMRAKGAQVTGEDLLAVMNGESGVKATTKGPRAPDGSSANADGLWDYGLTGIHGPDGLRAVGWKGTPEEFVALDAADQLPYVEKYFSKFIPAYAWSAVKGARSLYAANAWPSYFAARPGAFQVDEYVIARRNKGAYYSGFDFDGDGTNKARDVDRWIGKQQINGGARWIEIRERYWIESGEAREELSTVGAVKGVVFIGMCGALALFLAHDA